MPPKDYNETNSTMLLGYVSACTIKTTTLQMIEKMSNKLSQKSALGLAGRQGCVSRFYEIQCHNLLGGTDCGASQNYKIRRIVDSECRLKFAFQLRPIF